MSATTKFLAFDLGAESGRAVIGHFDGERLRLEDVHRFATGSTRILDSLQWDALRLFTEIKRGIGLAVQAHGADFAGIGIDTWGVDFGLLGRNDTLLGNPRHYRDHGNDGILEAAFEIVPRRELFDRTGIQFIQFNSLFQLLALKRMGSPLLDVATTLLMMPDLFNFWLSGEKATEYSIASTTQILDPFKRTWDLDLVGRMGLPTNLFTDIVAPGGRIGTLLPHIAEETGCSRAPILAPAEHDTGSAVVAVPASSPDYAYISSGTWSLMGIEVPQPVINEATAAANFTNEGGACGTIRLLKNIMGLWLVQECRRSISRQGVDLTYAHLTEGAAAAPPFGPLIDPDAEGFLAPNDMEAAIEAFCLSTGQTPPQGADALIRCCLESLALKYRWTMERLEEFRGSRIEVIHIVGGGTQNRLLCQLAADATRRTVIAGPVEATAMGNILMQAMAVGAISSLNDARRVVRASCELEVFEPSGSVLEWEGAYERFLALMSRGV
jgi:rhamnulokinase